VIDWFDNNAPSLSSAVAEWLNMQQMLLYPLDYRDGEGRLFDVQEIVDSHVLYLTELFAIEQPQHIEETDRHVEIIRQIKSIEMKEH
jgi:superfamily I DNA and/or RNA helicase